MIVVQKNGYFNRSVFDEKHPLNAGMDAADMSRIPYEKLAGFHCDDETCDRVDDLVAVYLGEKGDTSRIFCTDHVDVHRLVAEAVMSAEERLARGLY